MFNLSAGRAPGKPILALPLTLPNTRGALASDADKEQVASLLASLEAASFAAPRGGGAPALGLDGRWELLYSNVEAFRASPFFQAFTNVVDGLTDAAGLTGTINVGGSLSDAIFAFTDAIPNATIGAARQTLMPGSLVSEVDLTVFPGLKGTVVTTSRIASRSGGGEGGAAGPIVLELMVDNTRVERSNFSPFLDGIAVPVEQLVSGGTQGKGPERLLLISYYTPVCGLVPGAG